MYVYIYLALAACQVHQVELAHTEVVLPIPLLIALTSMSE